MSEHIENQTENVNNRLDALQSKIETLNNEDKFYSYEKDKNGVYFAKVNGVKLDVSFYNPKDLLGALQLIAHMISVYVKAGYKGALYANEDAWTKGDRESMIDIKVDNRIAFDTTFLTSESIRKTFGINDTRNKMDTQKIADFLNQVLGLTQKKEANS